MADYIPTEDEVETAFHEFASERETMGPGTYPEAPEFTDWREAMAGFRRWLAAVRREAAAEALTAASDALADDEDMVINVALGGAPYVSSWLRERASAIRNETKEAK